MTRLDSAWQRVLFNERWRREVHGLPPHPALAQIEMPLQPAAWYPPRDDRRDPLSAAGLAAAMRAHAARCCQLIGDAVVEARAQGRVRLHYQLNGNFNALCSSEPFWCQPVLIERRGELFGSFGYSGYLVAPDVVLTCWHGWEHFQHSRQLALFGYAARSPCDRPVELPEGQVVPIALDALRAGSRPGDADVCVGDWVLLRLERPAALPGGAAPPLAVPRIAAPRVGAAVYALGHPLGLPLKLSAGARILSVEGGTFRADLDTYTGSSGGPVFDADTHALLGIVVEGQPGEGDFEPSPRRGCYVSNRIDARVRGQLCVAASCFAAALATLQPPR